MIRNTTLALAGGVLLVAVAAVSPGSAAGLLNGLLDDVVTVSSGTASNTGLVNVGLGGSNLASVKVGGATSNLIDADVAVLGAGGVASVSGNVAGLVGADINVGGDGGLLSADINVGGDGGIDVCLDLLASDCTPAGGGGGGGGGGGSGGGGNGNGGGGDGHGVASLRAACASPDDQRAINLLRSTHYDMSVFASWARATIVKIVPMRPCPPVKASIASAIRGSSAMDLLHRAVQRDILINATLGRTQYDPEDVLAVRKSGQTVQVYVF